MVVVVVDFCLLICLFVFFLKIFSPISKKFLVIVTEASFGQATAWRHKDRRG